MYVDGWALFWLIMVALASGTFGFLFGVFFAAAMLRGRDTTED